MNILNSSHCLQRVALHIALLFVTVFSATAQTQYVVTLGNMTVWNGVAHRVDTDYIALSVTGPNSQKFSKTIGPYNLHKNNVMNCALSSIAINVPADGSTLAISWAAINKGSTNIQTIGHTLSDIAGTIGQSSQDPRVVIAATIVKVFGGHFLANCDVPLFGGRLTFTGANLATGHLGSPWSSEGPNKWHAVFDFPNIKSPCDTGHYNLEIHIQKR